MDVATGANSTDAKIGATGASWCRRGITPPLHADGGANPSKKKRSN